MPQRALSLALAVAGLVVVSAILLTGRDAYAAALRGPRWRRRLVAAGIALLTLVGIPAGGRDAPAPPGSRGASEEAGAREWRRIVETWSDAEEVASGKRGPYPFDEKGQKRLLERLAAAAEDAEVLGAAWKLSDAEVGLLKKGLARLVEGVQEKRPMELESVTCYEPMPMNWSESQSVRRLADRLPLLEKAAAAERLRPEVIRRAIAGVEQDLTVLEAEGALARMSGPERTKAEGLRDAVRGKLKAIEARFGK